MYWGAGGQVGCRGNSLSEQYFLRPQLGRCDGVLNSGGWNHLGGQRAHAWQQMDSPRTHPHADPLCGLGLLTARWPGQSCLSGASGPRAKSQHAKPRCSSRLSSEGTQHPSRGLSVRGDRAHRRAKGGWQSPRGLGGCRRSIFGKHDLPQHPSQTVVR